MRTSMLIPLAVVCLTSSAAQAQTTSPTEAMLARTPMPTAAITPQGFEGSSGFDRGDSPGGSGPSGIVPPPQADTAPSGAGPD